MRRLQLCYGEAASLYITTDANGTTVSFLVPATASLVKKGTLRGSAPTLGLILNEERAIATSSSAATRALCTFFQHAYALFDSSVKLLPAVSAGAPKLKRSGAGGRS